MFEYEFQVDAPPLFQPLFPLLQGPTAVKGILKRGAESKETLSCEGTLEVLSLNTRKQFFKKYEQ